MGSLLSASFYSRPCKINFRVEIKVRRIRPQVVQVAPKASITSFTPGTLWAGRLSITTMSWHLNIGRQAVLPIGDESSLDRSVDNHRGHHLLCRNAATNVIVFHALRNMVDQSLATRATSPETDHIGAGQRHRLSRTCPRDQFVLLAIRTKAVSSVL